MRPNINKDGFYLRAANKRGLTEMGWLKSRHTFSFGYYHDPLHDHFGVLRVINDDWIQAKSGFGAHSHRNMEIITYAVQGALAHRDSLDHETIIPAGDIQWMSAGTGITHSEYNAAPTASRFIQIWIEPDQKGYTPSYQQHAVPAEAKKDQWLLIVSPDEGGLLPIRQDVRLYTAFLSPQGTLSFMVKPSRWVWLQVVSGQLHVNDFQLEEGDGLAITAPQLLQFSQAQGADLLLLDLPAAT